ncbi:hypothetical protein Tsubulata_002735 [Turnera subulata]|uniref:F-box domain-containing protein n=1 Tax=Turnera subulata TaxID=218843 RepID=A0A9Q0GF05_9ROSI|nr:hypothetical protein Tsubulata_002735 [Turnera subulata]
MEEKLTTESGNGGAEDRITKLPEPIIQCIFSFLETIDVIRSSAVSRSWRHLWTSIPHLSFTQSTVWTDSSTNRRFKDFVNWVLINRNPSVCIEKFRLTNYWFEEEGDRDGKNWFYRWVSLAARGNVKELDLSIYPDVPISFPYSLVTCQSLVALKVELWMRVLHLPAVTSGFPSLKSLELKRLTLNDENVARNFIAGCHILEHLSLNSCVFQGFKVLEIYSANLKCLNISDTSYLEGTILAGGLSGSKLEVDCPKLVSFTFSGPSALEYSFKNLLSIDKASIVWTPAFEGQEIYNLVSQVLSGLRNAKVLALYPLFFPTSVERLYPAKLESLSFSRLKVLELDSSHINWVKLLLKCAPNLEVLLLLILFPKEHQVEDETTLLEREDQNIEFECLRKSLKRIHLIFVRGYKVELELIRFLLKHGLALEEMTIIWKRDVESKYTSEAQEEILQFQKASSSVSLSFL